MITINQEFLLSVACIKYNKEYNVLRSDCLEIRGVKVKTQACIPVVKPKLEAYKFVPFIARNVNLSSPHEAEILNIYSFSII